MRRIGLVAFLAAVAVIGLAWFVLHPTRRIPPSKGDAISVVGAPTVMHPADASPAPSTASPDADTRLRDTVERDVRKALGDPGIAILTARASGKAEGATCGEMAGPSRVPVRYVWVQFARKLARDDGGAAFRELAREACPQAAR